MPTSHRLFIKNMVCQRCILAVQNIVDRLKLPVRGISMGELVLEKKLSLEEAQRLSSELKQVGFEVIETRLKKVIEDIKLAVLDYLTRISETKSQRLSGFITDRVPNDYSYLSDLFSSIEGKTIEQFFLLQRMEKVKEFLVYDQLSLTQIADETGFSSVHHLSAQFKKINGLTPSQFKKTAGGKRKPLDQL